MPPGPPKSFDPDRALESARDVFWRRGFDGVGVAQLETTLGIGRKSLYDTFGNKRSLYQRAIDQYTDTVIERIRQGLLDERGDALENLQRVLSRLGEHHASADSLGCLLGVAAGQLDPEDDELRGALRASLDRLAGAFERALAEGQRAGVVRRDLAPRDMASTLLALVQGVALLGRTTNETSLPDSVVRALIDSLHP